MFELDLGVHLSHEFKFSTSMQQKLQLLQVPMYELQQMIAEEVMQNPLLELENNLGLKTENMRQDRTLLSDEWKNYLPNSSEINQKKRDFIFDTTTSQKTLQSFILEQAIDCSKSEKDHIEMIIGNLDNDGYLRMNFDQLMHALNLSSVELNQILSKIHTFEPYGIASFTLAECLMIQLSYKYPNEKLAIEIVKNHLENVACHQYKKICNLLNVKMNEVLNAVKVISSLEPKPARSFANTDYGVVIPDIIVVENNGKFYTHWNEDNLTNIKINQEYKTLLSEHAHQKDIKQYLREKMKNAKLFIQNIQQRQSTCLLVSQAMMEYQIEFLKYGIEKMKPLIMVDIAESVGLHVTTVSRAVSGKYISTPHGIFELRYFFSSGFQHINGSSLSKLTLQQIIFELIQNESKITPLKDQEIVDLLKERGFNIGRRTVTKYREKMKILPSRLRKY